ncbi:MAG: TraR/DksA family transcriptional regulator [candidate division WOR-3 bacterium]|nr:TraR/DksA family transcriptional regulator [candidate division WOR-3 bacterium]MCX7756965.1 TraR/DksA family transcriptional regulator [candidate division WOR-3 bacterium]MDW7987547.1 TraR/DksA family transcriptional regulator [candidate division WOR-3 bacterium]
MKAKKKTTIKSQRAQKELTDKDLMRFEAQLLKLKQQILKQKQYVDGIVLTPQGEAGAEVSSYRTHVADVGNEVYQREVISQISSYDAKILRQIDEALKRIREKNYGICVGCQKPIAKARLKALPYTDLCIECSKKLG